jgi:hypothetical protein
MFWVNVPIGVVALVAAAKMLPREVTAQSNLDSSTSWEPRRLSPAWASSCSQSPAASRTAGCPPRPSSVSRCPQRYCRLRARRAPYRSITGPPAHAVHQAACLGHRRDTRRDRSAGRSSVPDHSIFFQTVLGYSALEADSDSYPLLSPLVVGTHLATHISAHAAARTVAAIGLLTAGAGALLVSRASSDAVYALNLLPGLVVVGLGAGMVFVASQPRRWQASLPSTPGWPRDS